MNVSYRQNQTKTKRALCTTIGTSSRFMLMFFLFIRFIRRKTFGRLIQCHKTSTEHASKFNSVSQMAQIRLNWQFKFHDFS